MRIPKTEIQSFAQELTRREKRDSEINIADMTEVVAVMSDIFFEGGPRFTAEMAEVLFENGRRRNEEALRNIGLF